MDMVVTLVRQLLLFVHTLAFAFALVTVLREDAALLTARQVDAARLQAIARTTGRLLALLWFTGLGLVGLGIGIDLAAIAAHPKLAAKLTVVGLLTVNGMLLHRLAFPLLTGVRAPWPYAATACAALGAVSTVTWVFASFVGVSRLIAPAMSYGGFICLYLLSLVGGLGVALCLIRPQVMRLMTNAPVAIERLPPSTFGPAT